MIALCSFPWRVLFSLSVRDFPDRDWIEGPRMRVVLSMLNVFNGL